MAYDEDRITDTVLALLTLTFHDESEFGCRAWKSHDWSVLNQLHERGYISNPKNKNKSVALTPAGMQRARRLFDEFFATRDITTACNGAAGPIEQS